MAFDVKQFRKNQYKPREGTVKVPALAYLFEDGEPAEFAVRGLQGAELAKCQEAENQAQNWQALIAAMAGKNRDEKIRELQAFLGRSDRVPAQLLRMIEACELGITEPKLERADVVKLADAAPVEFQDIANTIFRLTGEGAEPGKSNGSGETIPSEPRSHSETEPASSSSKSAQTSSQKGG